MAADLGQHFLVDEGAVAQLVAAARLQPGEVVLDVGAGEGVLTRRLAEAVRPGGRVVAVELDPALAARLRAQRLRGVEVVEGDALQVPLPEPLDAVVANPPFRVLSPLLARLLGAGPGRLLLVVPREFAGRVLARPGTERYGRLTVQLALRAEAERVADLPRRAFAPPPEVPASILRLVPRGLPPGVEPEVLDAVLEAAWASKRRTLRHGLGTLGPALRISSGAITEALRRRGWERRLPGQLGPRDYAALAAELGAARSPR
jgi:16S rRNA (adenine1518-N6/adenine1519-N6)-dimethyltransferase